MIARTRLIADDRGARQGRHGAGRAHQRVGAVVGGENRDRDRLLGGPLRSRRAAAQRGPRPRPLCRCPRPHRWQRDGVRSRRCCWPPTPTPWTSAWMRWRARCATVIRAPLSSAAPTRWGRWVTAATGWRAAATIRACDAAGVQPSAMVVHVVADEESLTDDTARAAGRGICTRAHRCRAAADDDQGSAEPAPEDPIARFAASAPAVIIGGAILPAPLLAAKLAHTAKIVPIIHPGDCPAGTALHPVGGVGDVRALPRPDVPVPRLRRPRRRLRCGPHHRRIRWGRRRRPI